jgi:hypothetical protein
MRGVFYFLGKIEVCFTLVCWVCEYVVNISSSRVFSLRRFCDTILSGAALRMFRLRNAWAAYSRDWCRMPLGAIE